MTVAGGLGAMLTAARRKEVILRDEKNSPPTPANFRELMTLAGDGRIEPVIDTVLPFDQIAEAHRRVDGGHKVGSIVLTWDSP